MRILSSVVFALFILAGCSSPAEADQKFREAVTLLQGGTAEAIQRGRDALELAAKYGSPDAALNLGYMYLKGQAGLTVDPAKALSYFTKAAHAGNIDAMYNAGLAYLRGSGTEVDMEEAFRWFEKAAYAGDAGAQYNTGLMLLSGEGVEADPVMAMVWFYLANEQGYEGASDGGRAARMAMTEEQAQEFETVLARTRDRVISQPSASQSIPL